MLVSQGQFTFGVFIETIPYWSDRLPRTPSQPADRWPPIFLPTRHYNLALGGVRPRRCSKYRQLPKQNERMQKISVWVNRDPGVPLAAQAPWSLRSEILSEGNCSGPPRRRLPQLRHRRVALEGHDQGVEGVDRLLTKGEEVGARGGERSGAGHGTEADEDLLLELRHRDFAFGLVVVERHAQIGEEAQDVVAAILQADDEVAGGVCLTRQRRPGGPLRRGWRPWACARSAS